MSEEQRVTRLNKYLSEAGVCSRREADRLIEAGEILVNGEKAVPGQKVGQQDKVLYKGKSICKEEEVLMLACYKPAGIVCTTAVEENGEKINNIVEYIGYPKRIYPVGRLDKDSEGLILLTNQGQMMERILRSRYEHEKEYYVKVNKPLTQAFLEGMRKGVPILDTVTKPCKVKKVSDYSFRIILTQGLNRQIRRMCEHFDYRVVFLRRDRVMNITLGDLKKGQYRKLTKEEIERLQAQL